MTERFTDEERLRASPATRDHATEDRTATAERFSDEEAAFLRHARFGELPERVSPDERVELVEADPRAEVIQRPFDHDEWAGRT